MGAFLTPAPAQLTGGIAAAVFVTMGALLIPYMGFGLYFVVVVFGQICCSLVLDHVGFLGIPKLPFTRLRAAAAGMCLLGATLAVVQHTTVSREVSVPLGLLHAILACCAGAHLGATCGRPRTPASLPHPSPGRARGPALAPLPLAPGAAGPLQACVNRHLSTKLARPAEAALVNCLVGSVVMAVVSLIAVVTTPGGMGSLSDTTPPMYLGGVIGIALVMSAILFAGRVGVGTYFTLVILGQLVTSAIYDAVGAFAHRQRGVGVLAILGIIAVAGGGACFGYAKHLATKPSKEPAAAVEAADVEPPEGHYSEFPGERADE